MLLPGRRAVAVILALSLGGQSVLFGEEEQYSAEDVGRLLTERRYHDLQPVLQRIERQWAAEVDKENSPLNRYDWARTLHSLGAIEKKIGLADEAVKHLRLARDLTLEGKFNEFDPPVVLAELLDNLGLAETAAGHYREAEQSLQTAIEEHSKFPPGDRDPWLAASENNLGMLYLLTGRYEEAGRIFHQTVNRSGDSQEALVLQDECLGKYFYVMRSYAKAAEHLEKARENALALGGLQKTSPEILSLTGQIGLALLRLPDRHSKELARDYLSEAAELTRMLEDSRVNRVALASHLSNLGSLELEQEHNQKAQELFREGLSILEEQLGKDAPALAPCYTNLGYASQVLGHHEEARDAYQKAVDLYRSSVGTSHQACVEAELNYAESLFLSTGPTEQTLAAIRQHTGNALNLFEDIISFGTERQRLNWLRENHLLTLPCSLGRDPGFIANTLLRTKARIIDSLLSEKTTASLDPQFGNLREDFERKQRELDDLLFRKAEQEKITQVHDEITALEARLRNLPRDSATSSISASWKTIQATLPTGSAFVDYVRYPDLNRSGERSHAYGAILILPVGEPRWIPLGTEEELHFWLGVLRARLEYRTYVLTSAQSANPPLLRMSSALRGLHDHFWGPVAAHLPAGTDTIGISPDAGLNFVSFAVLLDEEMRFLANKFRQLVYYTSGRDLLIDEKRPALQDGPWAVIAVPEFETHKRPAEGEAGTSDELSRSVLDNIEGFSDIPGVREELKRVEKIMPRRSDGAILSNASEQQVRSLSESPVVLHVSSHAFLLPPAEEGASARVELDDLHQAPDHFYRSGLVLTEAKRAHAARERGTAVPFAEDGILFSNEVKNLPLQNTRLVTLSSCNSGMGDSVRGDGVLGLRRGFTLAGSSSILMSLWPVVDDSTPAFMETMYRLSLATDQVGQSLWESQRRKLGRIDPVDDAALEEAVLRYGCFVLSQRGPLQSAVRMPELRDPSRGGWAIALALAGILLFIATRRKWRPARS